MSSDEEQRENNYLSENDKCNEYNEDDDEDEEEEEKVMEIHDKEKVIEINENIENVEESIVIKNDNNEEKKN